MKLRFLQNLLHFRDFPSDDNLVNLCYLFMTQFLILYPIYIANYQRMWDTLNQLQVMNELGKEFSWLPNKVDKMCDYREFQFL